MLLVILYHSIIIDYGLWGTISKNYHSLGVTIDQNAYRYKFNFSLSLIARAVKLLH